MAGRARKQKVRKQLRLWPEGQPPLKRASTSKAAKSETPSDPADAKSWKLDPKTKRVGRAGIAAARKRIRRPGKSR